MAAAEEKEGREKRLARSDGARTIQVISMRVRSGAIAEMNQK